MFQDIKQVFRKRRNLSEAIISYVFITGFLAFFSFCDVSDSRYSQTGYLTG